MAFLVHEGILVRRKPTGTWFLSLGPVGNTALGWPVVCYEQGNQSFVRLSDKVGPADLGWLV
eukprot:10179262-Lingulodinium_polyedra.AAC.1